MLLIIYCKTDCMNDNINSCLIQDHLNRSKRDFEQKGALVLLFLLQIIKNLSYNITEI